jgi:hypothetical protein
VHYTSDELVEEPDVVIPHVRICMGGQVTGRPTIKDSKFVVVKIFCQIFTVVVGFSKGELHEGSSTYYFAWNR